MTPQEFKEKMIEIFPLDGSHEEDTAHVAGDKLMCQLLTELGYIDGVMIFITSDKWYS